MIRDLPPFWRPTWLVIGVLAAATVLARRLGHRLGRNTIVRLRAPDRGITRLQSCPVGKPWSLVVPVRDSRLTDERREFARAHHDLPVP